MNLVRILQHLYPASTANVDYKVHMIDGKQVIREWALNAIQPTQAQLLAAEPAAELAYWRVFRANEFSNNARNEIIAGFSSSALGTAHTYDSAIEDQINLSGAAAIGADIDFTCTDESNNTKAAITHTSAQIKQVLGDGASIKIAILNKYRALKIQIEAASDVAAVHALVWV